MPGAVTDAGAQEETQRPWSLRGILYPDRERIQRPGRQRAEPPPGAMPAQPRSPQAARPQPSAAKPARKAVPKPASRAPQAATAKAALPPEPEPVEKAADAKVVLVVGDFIGSAAAEGLDGLFAQEAKVRIVDRTNGASGLVRDDYFDWPGRIAALIETEKPAAVVVAIGANDRQPMRIGSVREPVRSQAWAREYAARAASFASEVVGGRTPMIWLGTPSFKSNRMNADMLAFNEIYRSVAADAGLEFVEVWDGFAGEDGKFVATGPDVSGRPVRLRSEDGINLTAAGKQKLAFYTEKELRRLLGLTSPQTGVAVGQPDAASGLPPPGQVPAVERTPPISLNDPALDGGEVLLGATVGMPRAAVITAPPVPGRVDDYAVAGPPATAPLEKGAERTSALGERPAETDKH
ncbi:MAG: DUF459 domain-containing protein [Rhizobiaceae bacterium]|nr:DUF459 domain-containing protein [Rhizobiaceae bacterium]